MVAISNILLEIFLSKSHARLWAAVERKRQWGELAGEAILMGDKFQKSVLCDQILVIFRFARLRGSEGILKKRRILSKIRALGRGCGGLRGFFPEVR